MRPVVLCFSGLDPSGGAGLQADIETIATLGGHAAVVATALTVQDSQRVHGFELVNPALMQAQARAVLADLPVAAIKIGMLGAAAAVTTVFSVLAEHPDLPVVLDPVLAANSGGNLAADDLRQALLAVLPRVHLLTPNSLELRRLAATNDLDLAVQQLYQAGAGGIWLKGGHEPGNIIVNRLYENGCCTQVTQQDRLPGEFHGSGCTMAAAVAVALAKGKSRQAACRLAEQFTAQALRAADRPRDEGQWLPRRIATRS